MATFFWGGGYEVTVVEVKEEKEKEKGYESPRIKEKINNILIKLPFLLGKKVRMKNEERKMKKDGKIKKKKKSKGERRK